MHERVPVYFKFPEGKGLSEAEAGTSIIAMVTEEATKSHASEKEAPTAEEELLHLSLFPSKSRTAPKRWDLNLLFSYIIKG